MKKVLLVVLALMFTSIVSAATIGNGTCTTTFESLTSKQTASQAFTFTLGATYNLGGIALKWPASWAVPVVGQVSLTGNATEAKKVEIKQFPTNMVNNTYFVVTCTGTTAQTVIVTFANITNSATAGTHTFTWLSANTAKKAESMGVIASQPTGYLWESKGAVAVGTVGPSPVALVSDDKPFIAEVRWSVSPVLGGQLRWKLAQGTPGFQTTPNPLTLTSSEATGGNGNSWIVCTPGQYSTPVCNATECYANVAAAATIVLANVAKIYIGHPTPAVSVTPWHGSNYAKNMNIVIRANAVGAATDETPEAYATAAVSGNFLFLNATPTVCLTVVSDTNGVYQFNTNVTGLNNARNIFNYGATIKGTDGRFTPAKNGSYSVTANVLFKDVNNDGELRSNTTSAIVVYKLPEVNDTTLTNLILNGDVVKDLVIEDVAASGPFNITCFAVAQVILDADFWSNSAATFSRVVDGSVSTVNAFFMPVLATAGSFGTISSPYVIPAATFSRWYNNVAATITVNGILYRMPLAVR